MKAFRVMENSVILEYLWRFFTPDESLQFSYFFSCWVILNNDSTMALNLEPARPAWKKMTLKIKYILCEFGKSKTVWDFLNYYSLNGGKFHILQKNRLLQGWFVFDWGRKNHFTMWERDRWWHYYKIHLICFI